MLPPAQAHTDLLQQRMTDTNDCQFLSRATESKKLTHCLLHGPYYATVGPQIHLRALSL